MLNKTMLTILTQRSRSCSGKHEASRLAVLYRHLREVCGNIYGRVDEISRTRDRPPHRADRAPNDPDKI